MNNVPNKHKNRSSLHSLLWNSLVAVLLLLFYISIPLSFAFSARNEKVAFEQSLTEEDHAYIEEMSKQIRFAPSFSLLECKENNLTKLIVCECGENGETIWVEGSGEPRVEINLDDLGDINNLKFLLEIVRVIPPNHEDYEMAKQRFAQAVREAGKSKSSGHH